MRIRRLSEIDGKFVEEEIIGTETYEKDGVQKINFTFRATGNHVSIDDLMQFPAKTFAQKKTADNSPTTLAVLHGESLNADYVICPINGSLMQGFYCEAQYFIRK